MRQFFLKNNDHKNGFLQPLQIFLLNFSSYQYPYALVKQACIFGSWDFSSSEMEFEGAKDAEATLLACILIAIKICNTMIAIINFLIYFLAISFLQC
jgi:hypothetical protein